MKINKQRFVRIVMFVLFGCVCFTSGLVFTHINITRGATTTYLLANYDLDTMVTYSDLIVSGKVVHISDAFWDENNSSIIRREAILNVDEVFNGSEEVVSSSIKILLTGGKIGNYIHDVEPFVDLNVGDDMILFLRKSNDGEHYVILNSTQGVLYVDPIACLSNDTDKTSIVYSTAENWNFYFHSTTKNELKQSIAKIKGGS